MKLSEIIPKRGERMLIAGTTGTGKTVAVRSVVSALLATSEEPDELVIIHDPKATFKGPEGTERVNGLSRLQRLIKDGVVPKIFRYVPSPEENNDAVGLQNPLWHWIITRGRKGKKTILVLDEAYSAVSDTGRGGANLRAIWTQGRELGITSIVLTQRPRNIPVYFLTEAERYLVYDLPDEDDRDRIARVTTRELENPPTADFSAWFWYRKTRKEPPRLVRFPENPTKKETGK